MPDYEQCRSSPYDKGVVSCSSCGYSLPSSLSYSPNNNPSQPYGKVFAITQSKPARRDSLIF